MIDNITLRFELDYNENWLKKICSKHSFKETQYARNCSVLIGNLFLNDTRDYLENKNKPSLRIEIKKTINQPLKITIKNSLRKWYFNRNICGDFTKIEFLECIILISEKLEIPKEAILNAKVTKLEYGANLHLKPKYRCFSHCLHEHLEFKKKCIYGNETLEFKGENKSVIFYDKITEQKDKKNIKAKHQKKLNAVKLLLRYEIKIDKMSGCSEKSKMSFVKDIILNWSEIIDLWKNELDSITFVNDMSPKIYDDLKDAKIKPMKDYLIYLGVKSIGLNKFGFILEDRMFVKSRKQLSDEILKKYGQFDLLMKQENFEKTFRNIVNLKAKKLLA